MFGFAIKDGDLSMKDGKIQPVEDEYLLCQKLQAVWSTNLGEWDADPEEGIDFDSFLGKDPDEDEMRAELETALGKVSETATITSFEVIKDRSTRKMTINVGVHDGESEITVPLEL